VLKLQSLLSKMCERQTLSHLRMQNDETACRMDVSKNMTRDFCGYCRLLRCFASGMRSEDVKVPSKSILRSEIALSYLFTNEEEDMLKSKMDQYVSQSNDTFQGASNVF